VLELLHNLFSLHLHLLLRSAPHVCLKSRAWVSLVFYLRLIFHTSSLLLSWFLHWENKKSLHCFCLQSWELYRLLYTRGSRRPVSKFPIEQHISFYTTLPLSIFPRPPSTSVESSLHWRELCQHQGRHQYLIQFYRHKSTHFSITLSPSLDSSSRRAKSQPERTTQLLLTRITDCYWRQALPYLISIYPQTSTHQTKDFQIKGYQYFVLKLTSHQLPKISRDSHDPLINEREIPSATGEAVSICSGNHHHPSWPIWDVAACPLGSKARLISWRTDTLRSKWPTKENQLLIGTKAGVASARRDSHIMAIVRESMGSLEVTSSHSTIGPTCLNVIINVLHG